MFENIGQAVQYYRKQIQLSEKELANKTEMEISKIIKIENNQLAVSLEDVQNIAEALKVNPNQLLYVQSKDNHDEPDIHRINLLLDVLHTQEEIFNKTN